MKDRRHNLYCGPEHKLIPTLEALANAIQIILQESKMSDREGNRLITDTTYAGKMKIIHSMAICAQVEIDKLIIIDTQEVQNKKER